MDAFRLRDEIVNQYKSYVKSFINIRDQRIDNEVNRTVERDLLWPDPLIQINPKFQTGESITDFIEQGILDPECKKIFAMKKENQLPKPLTLYKHQAEAIKIANRGENYILTTGTGSGKSLAYIIPIVNYALKNKDKKGIKAIIVYPLNALANSQIEELTRFVNRDYPNEKGPVTFKKYTGQESDEEKQEVRANPPDILLTNYVMLELILTRPEEKSIIRNAQGLKFLVLDELHTYRGRQGADVAMLVRRAKSYFNATDMISVGTSATMAGEGTKEESNAQVASVATKLFGALVKPKNVIGETLTRVTDNSDINDMDFIEALGRRLKKAEFPETLVDFKKDVLAQWVETTFGVEQLDDGSLRRAEPKPIRGRNGVAGKLAHLLSMQKDETESFIRKMLDVGNTIKSEDSEDKPCFAYRLHQFISPSETVFTTLETPETRKVTLSGQYYSPSDPDKILYPMVFCRECGQEFYSVRHNSEEGLVEPRAFHDRQKEDDDGTAGYLYLNTEDPWPEDREEALKRLPEDWLDEKAGKLLLPRNRRTWAPEVLHLNETGDETEKGMQFAFIRSPFRFCPKCGIVYASQQRSDFGKLASLGTEGRSTATTILTLGAIAELLKDSDFEKEAKKLLSFTDNRQDASLQAGHFNDFIHMGILRAGIYKAIEKAGEEGIEHDDLVDRVFNAMNIPFPEYSRDPDLIPIARTDVNKAFKGVLGYRIYNDLSRGWRVNVPNLEQVGLLKIEYKHLKLIAEGNEFWAASHEALAFATAEARERILKTLLDYMRRELVLKVDFLEPDYQERLLRLSNQHLNDPWALDEDDKLAYSSILFPTTRPKDGGYLGNTKKYRYVSSRGGMGRYLRRISTLPGYSDKLSLDDIDRIIKNLLEVLRKGGIVEQLPASRSGLTGFRLNASSLIWKAGDGTAPAPDQIRVVRESESTAKTNEYFKRFYIEVGNRIPDIKAAEHTAQVKNEIRQQRENDFRSAKLPVLFCSPTMELGVDIAQLNVVNMRNVPPNPANYAQRSGRAGRSGQPALVFTYCGKRRPHDQYFFRRPEKMVAGAVIPPRIDMVNEELILSHLHAIWLAETGVKLGKSLKDILSLPERGGEPVLYPHIREEFEDPHARQRTLKRVAAIYADLIPDLEKSFWYKDGWFEDQLSRVMDRFDQATERWKYLYSSAVSQMDQQHKINLDASRDKKQRDRSQTLYREAKRQRDLLLNENFDLGSDFYSYRYFASEGFLPGYNFPRLPLNAYIPGRRRNEGEYLSRSRFLAISEFGPRSMIYHEGAKYEIDRVIFQVDGTEITTGEVKICEECGYLHEVNNNPTQDLCENCGTELPVPMTNMFRLRNVSTRRRERISTDEEERMRYGFELKTAVKFAKSAQGRHIKTSTVEDKDKDTILTLKYGPSATIWRINLGWKRRKDQYRYGFVLDIEKGRWEKQDKEANTDDPTAALTKRVIPYVEDTKNCLIIKPEEPLPKEEFFSLMAALKNAIQLVYKIEDRELAAEALPDKANPTSILLYESSEGGAGVLERILNETSSINKIAEEALRICHFNPTTGENEASEEECSKACYSCLMSYYNQSEHKLLDRNKIKDLLMNLKQSTHKISPKDTTRQDHLNRLKALCDSTLEIEWLDFLEKNNLNLPDKAQVLIEQANTRVDFLYEYLAVYIDGPVHDESRTQADDKAKREALEDMGYTVVSFRYDEKTNWMNPIRILKSVFGYTGED
ncbi:MAG: DEAD/DEAH box helicase [Candidatus Sabulitectum sp.]|nr:DEAD/DEAH box helicase [Candidatus Sabulitectum sp.]